MKPKRSPSKTVFLPPDSVTDVSVWERAVMRCLKKGGDVRVLLADRKCMESNAK